VAYPGILNGGRRLAGGILAKDPNRRGQGGIGMKTPALSDFFNFSIKITHFYAYFGQILKLF